VERKKEMIKRWEKNERERRGEKKRRREKARIPLTSSVQLCNRS